MRRVIVSEYVTLDGVIEDTGGAEGFEYGGWSMRYFDADGVLRQLKRHGFYRAAGGRSRVS